MSLIPAHGRWLVKAIKRKSKIYSYPVEATAYKKVIHHLQVGGMSVSRARKLVKITGLAYVRSKYHYLVRVDRAGEVKRFLLAKGRAVLDCHSLYGVKSVLAMGSRVTHTVKGRVGQRLSQLCTVNGHLSSNVVNFLLGLQGYIPKIAFIAAVPKKYQDFISNKRWFR